MKYQFLLNARLIQSIQLSAGSPENCPGSVKEMLLAAVWQLRTDPGRYAVNPGRDFTRSRKIRLQNLLLMLLTMEADCLKEEIYRFFGRTTDAPSKAELNIVYTHETIHYLCNAQIMYCQNKLRII